MPVDTNYSCCMPHPAGRTCGSSFSCSWLLVKSATETSQNQIGGEKNECIMSSDGSPKQFPDFQDITVSARLQIQKWADLIVKLYEGVMKEAPTSFKHPFSEQRHICSEGFIHPAELELLQLCGNMQK